MTRNPRKSYCIHIECETTGSQKVSCLIGRLHWKSSWRTWQMSVSSHGRSHDNRHLGDRDDRVEGRWRGRTRGNRRWRTTCAGVAVGVKGGCHAGSPANVIDCVSPEEQRRGATRARAENRQDVRGWMLDKEEMLPEDGVAGVDRGWTRKTEA